MRATEPVLGAGEWSAVTVDAIGDDRACRLVADLALVVGGRDPASWVADELAYLLQGAVVLYCDGEPVGYYRTERLGADEASHVRINLELATTCSVAQRVEALAHVEGAVRFLQPARKLSIRVRTRPTTAAEACARAGWEFEGSLRGYGYLHGGRYDVAQFSAPPEEVEPHVACG